MPSLLLYLDSAWEMTVLPHPKAPGMAHVPKKTECVISLMLSIWCHCLLYLDSAWEMTVLPHPKAPGMAHVPKKTKCALSVMLQICCHCYCTGERLGNDCLATPESPRNGTCTWRIRCLISVMLAFAGTVTLLLRQHLRKDCHARPASHTTSACV